MTRANPCELHPYDPEIERKFHRALRKNRMYLLGSHSMHHNAFASIDSAEIPLLEFEPESPSVSVTLSDSVFDSISLSSTSSDFNSLFVHCENSENINMAAPARERTPRELAAPYFTYESLCIQYPDEEVPYELKTGLIHLLPKFNGLAGEDPHKHLKEFHIVCSTMKPHEVQEDHICLKAFPHSLEGLAKDWLYYLAPGSITSLDDLKRAFLDKFFLHQEPLQSEKTFLR